MIIIMMWVCNEMKVKTIAKKGSNGHETGNGIENLQHYKKAPLKNT